MIFNPIAVYGAISACEYCSDVSFVTHYVLLLVSDRNTWERISDESGIEIHGKESVQASVCYREHNNQCPYQFTPLPFTLRLQTPLPLPCQLTQSSAPLPFSLHLQPSFLFFGFHHSPLCNTPDAALKHAVFSVFFTAPLDNAI